MATGNQLTDSVAGVDDKWRVESGRILINGTQAIAKVLLARKALDQSKGLETAGYISGYRGSPLGNVDNTLWSITSRLEAGQILFAPGVNEDMAATAVRGTQQIDAVPGPRFEGVFAAWYGKGPGVDRSGDALKHGNFIGAHPKGGVVVFYGDDHGGKSSSLSHHSEQAMASFLIPSFYPSDPGEVIRYGLLAYELSRYSGLWVGLKLVNEVAEQTLTVDLDLPGFAPVVPPYERLPPEGVHVRGGALTPMRDEEIVSEFRLPLVAGFVRANSIDETIFRADRPRLGIVTAGKTYKDVLQALSLLGLDAPGAAAIGISLYKVGCIWPLEPTGLIDFAFGHEMLFFIEEKKAFVEQQAAAALINQPRTPKIVGKQNEEGQRLLPLAAQLEPARIADAIAGRLRALGIHEGWSREELRTQPGSGPRAGSGADVRRSPWFCSGCPHSRSTKVPDGSLAMAGIGCHVMTNFLKPERTLAPTHMGGEGGNWIGLAPFTDTRHIFQNMGDGTYYHSGLMAIRAAVASSVNITYKILYNDAVAMTGGQPVDGPISVAEMAHQVLHEGISALVVVSDDPRRHEGTDLPTGVRVEHRERLEAVQTSLRDVPGCTVIIYEQTCAAEKRRRRKRKTMEDPAKRLFISTAVCEGCGDCSQQSTCVSLTTVETEHGTKRAIDQSNCNKDFSCLDGFCPSFVTVYGAEPRKAAKIKRPRDLFGGLPDPARSPLDVRGFSTMIAGIGGTGVVTVAQCLAMAAHIDGLAVSVFDMTGLAQKNGAVLSHLRIARQQDQLFSAKIGSGEADLLLAFDLVAAMGDDSISSLAAGRTHAIVNADVAPTAALQFDRDARVDKAALFAALYARIGEDRVEALDASTIATVMTGDSIGTNFFMIGIAVQRGILPISCDAIERAIEINAAAVEFNLDAFRLGRLYACDPERVAALVPQKTAVPALSLDAILDERSRYLAEFQSGALAEHYRAVVSRIAEAERNCGVTDERLAILVAINFARVLAYKDEYEVARLLVSPEFEASLEAAFEEGGRIKFNLAPPILAGKLVNGRPRKREFDRRLARPAFRLLARLKFLRGTRLDIFGYTTERRAERALAADYERLIDLVIGKVTPHALKEAEALLGLVASVRGFGPVKEAAMDDYALRRPELEAAFVAAAGRQSGSD